MLRRTIGGRLLLLKNPSDDADILGQCNPIIIESYFTLASHWGHHGGGRIASDDDGRFGPDVARIRCVLTLIKFEYFIRDYTRN